MLKDVAYWIVFLVNTRLGYAGAKPRLWISSYLSLGTKALPALLLLHLIGLFAHKLL